MLMRRLDLNLLPIIVALHAHRNVSRAARSLGMSQPAVSAALAKLRRAFDDPLYVRTSRGMEPTPRAEALIAPTSDAMNKLDREVFVDVSFKPETTRHTFTLALSDVGEMVFLPKILETLTKLAPHASLRSVTPPLAELEQGLERGNIDLAIGYFPDLKRGNIFQKRLITHTYVCLLRADHPIRGHQLTLKQFLSLQHAVVRSESRGQEVFENFLAKKRIHRRVVLRTPHFTSVPMIIARSDLVVTVPHPLGLYFSSLTANLKIVKPGIAIPRIDLKQYWHRRFHQDPKNRWLRGLVADLFNDANDEWRIS
jgi:DNA-binding transcriptional LysR family regulator